MGKSRVQEMGMGFRLLSAELPRGMLRGLAVAAVLFANTGFAVAGPQVQEVTYSRSVPRPYAEAVTAIQSEAKAHGFRVSGMHDIAASLRKEGIVRAPYASIEVCNSRIAAEVLRAEPRAGALMPCRIAVYEQGGKTVISTVLASQLMGRLFPRSGLDAPARKVDAALKAIIDAAATTGQPSASAQDTALAHDTGVFMYMIQHHAAIRRTVKELPDGVETVTESDDPAVAAKIQEHVPAMYARLHEGRPVRQFDPLFVELFRHGSEVQDRIMQTPRGVRVSETSTDPYVVKLIKAHAKTIDELVSRGMAEMLTRHQSPAR